MAEVEQLVNKLVEELKSLGLLHEPQVEAAFRSVPRHLFIPDLPLQDVYLNRSIPTKYLDGRLVSSSSQPSIMAIMLAQLDLHPGLNSLEIGAGTGYNAALLAHLAGEGGQVTTIDIDEDIVAAARQHLADAGFDRVQVVCGDGGFGYPPKAPYDRILVTASAPDILPAWREHLKDGGRLVLPLAIGNMQLSAAFQKSGERLESRSVFECGFMPLRGTFATGLVHWHPLDPDSNLKLGVNDPAKTNPAEVYKWLLDSSFTTLDSGMHVTQQEAWASLQTWLAVQTANWCILTVFGEQVIRGPIPVIAGFGGPRPVGFSYGILGKGGMALLATSPDQTISLNDPNQEVSDSSFQLHIRLYGEGQYLVQHLTDLLRDWELNGRPPAKFLKLVSYPKSISPALTNNEHVLHYPHSTLVLRWNKDAT